MGVYDYTESGQEVGIKKELLFSVTEKDLDIQTFRAGGKGGQRQNKVSTGVRIIHKKSGARAESRETRSQKRNKELAFIKLTKTKEFKTWLRLESQRILSGRDLAKEYTEKAMTAANLKIEVKEDNQWREMRNVVDITK